jgi:hypothetical protein
MCPTELILRKHRDFWGAQNEASYPTTRKAINKLQPSLCVIQSFHNQSVVSIINCVAVCNERNEKHNVLNWVTVMSDNCTCHYPQGTGPNSSMTTIHICHPSELFLNSGQQHSWMNLSNLKRSILQRIFPSHPWDLQPLLSHGPGIWSFQRKQTAHSEASRTMPHGNNPAHATQLSRAQGHAMLPTREKATCSTAPRPSVLPFASPTASTRHGQ